MRLYSMILINGKKGSAKNAAGDNQRFYGTNQLKSKQIDNITSHNIYYVYYYIYYLGAMPLTFEALFRSEALL